MNRYYARAKNGNTKVTEGRGRPQSEQLADALDYLALNGDDCESRENWGRVFGADWRGRIGVMGGVLETV